MAVRTFGQVLTLDEVAERTKFSRRTVDRWVNKRLITTISVDEGHGVRVFEADLEEFLARHRRMAVQAKK